MEISQGLGPVGRTRVCEPSLQSSVESTWSVSGKAYGRKRGLAEGVNCGTMGW
jgi:hypothetical protein